jgi:hypothetical protein
MSSIDNALHQSAFVKWNRASIGGFEYDRNCSSYYNLNQLCEMIKVSVLAHHSMSVKVPKVPEKRWDLSPTGERSACLAHE